MSDPWEKNGPGVITLPSGRRVRGRRLRAPLPPGPEPEFGLNLGVRPPAPRPWEMRPVVWPDFWVPLVRAEAATVLREAWQVASDRPVEVACWGGVGRTGTALACLAVLDGLEPDDAVGFVREAYAHRAVETPWLRRFVRRFDQL